MKRFFSLLLCFIFFACALTACASEAQEPQTSVETAMPSGSAEASAEESAATQEPTAPTAPTADTATSESPTASPLSPEEQRDADDRAFLETIAFPKYEAGNEGEVFYLGRWFEKDVNGEAHHVTVTDGSQLFLMTRGCTSVTFDFTVITVKETPYFAVSIDGKEPKRQLITDKTVTLPNDGRHVLRVVADGMTESEAKWNDEIGFALKAVLPGEGGSIRAVIPKNKVVFFYGDSITEGVKTLGDNTSNGNSASSAYPWYTCENLGAIPYYIGYGASGVNVSGSFSTFINAIGKLSRTRDVDFSVKPDLIVVNHGTNDGNWERQDKNFSKNLKRALQELQKQYPGVTILVMIPFCQAHIADITEVCDALKNVHVLETKSVSMTTNDGLHPTKVASVSGGKKIAALIKEIVGEDFFTVA